MNILINFSTLKKGGGQNVAMNFLHEIFNLALEDITFYFFVAKDSEPHRFLKKLGKNNYHVVPSHPLVRILFEISKSKKILKENKIDIIYSYFGIGLFPSYIPQISGSADSNLYFPEINFWSHYSHIGRMKKRMIDLYRIYGVKKATAVIFENESMEARAKQLFGLAHTKFIKPSINFAFKRQNHMFFEGKFPKRGLFICGWQLNKNVHKIPEILFELKNKNMPFEIVITAEEDESSEYKIFRDLVRKYGVEDNIKMIGPVSKSMIPSLYEQIDYVFLLSKLESFSNTIIESWYFEKPLIVADETWARSICKNAAHYVDRESSKSIADAIITLDKNDRMIRELVDNGINELKSYPSISERIKEEIDYIKNVYKYY